jgi:hypothetical protein
MTKSDSARDQEKDKLILDVWYSMHKDLYGEDLQEGSIKFVQAPKPILDWLQEMSVWWPRLRQEGIDDWKDLSGIDALSVSAKTGIPREVLSRAKSIATEELRREEECRRFFERK